MNNTLRKVIFGKDNKFSGLIAFTIVGLFILGCNCNKKFGSGSSIDITPTASVTPTTIETPVAPPKPSFTKSDASKYEVPSDAEAQEIARTTLLDFNDALQTANFTTFYGNVAKAWQRQTSPVKMKELFQSFIDGRANISAVRSMDAKFSEPPAIGKTLGIKSLILKGAYATASIPTTFELKYIVESKEWKLVSIQVYTAIKK